MPLRPWVKRAWQIAKAFREGEYARTDQLTKQIVLDRIARDPKKYAPGTPGYQSLPPGARFLIDVESDKDKRKRRTWRPVQGPLPRKYTPGTFSSSWRSPGSSWAFRNRHSTWSDAPSAKSAGSVGVVAVPSARYYRRRRKWYPRRRRYRPWWIYRRRRK